MDLQLRAGNRLFSHVTERDLDLLLLEELWASQPFRSFFLGRCDLPVAGTSFVGAYHSVSDSMWGETDVLALFRLADGTAVGILIEDKVGAGFQPEQSVRYFRRIADGIRGGRWSRGIAVLVAPRDYLRSKPEEARFDVEISLEDVREHLLTATEPSDPRFFVKAALLTEAIDQQQRGWTLHPDEAATRFWHAYHRIAAAEFPQLKMRPPGQKPARSTWPQFFPSLPAGFALQHKLRFACVDLQLSKAASQDQGLLERLAKELPPNLHLQKTGQSYSIRAATLPLDFNGWGNDTAIRAGLVSADSLLQWFNAHRPLFVHL